MAKTPELDRTCPHCGDPEGLVLGQKKDEEGETLFYLVCTKCLKERTSGKVPGMGF